MLSVIRAFFSCLLFVSAAQPALADEWIFDERSAEANQQIAHLTRQRRAFKIVWWNVANCKVEPQALKANLEKLINSPLRPDFITFGEFHRHKCELLLGRLLLDAYPYLDHVPYTSPVDERGVVVYSRYPLTMGRTERLDWVPLDGSEAEQDQYRDQWLARRPGDEIGLPRYYRKYRVHAGRGLRIVPLHLNEPWEAIRDFDGTFLGALEMTFSENSPLAHQIDHLHQRLNRDFDTHPTADESDATRFVVLGDMNTPATVLGLQSRIYSSLRRGLYDIFSGLDTVGTDPLTFPAASDPHRGQFPFSAWTPQIDHAFTSRAFRRAVRAHEIVPLRGSDHYPLFIGLDIWN